MYCKLNIDNSLILVNFARAIKIKTIFTYHAKYKQFISYHFKTFIVFLIILKKKKMHATIYSRLALYDFLLPKFIKINFI